MNRIEIVRRDGSNGRPLVQSVIIFVCVLTFYAIVFLLLVPSNGSDAITLAIIPVSAAGWLWGWRIGVIAGILAAPLSVVFLSTVGPYGWDIFNSLGDLIGFSSIALVGGLIGYSRDLNRRANLEIKARQRAEAELRQHRDQLELIVASRTAELKQANERLQQALERAQDLSTLKSRFISMVSHEYRSPLTSILSAVGILRR
jgi:signal transduction histidine kinase